MNLQWLGTKLVEAATPATSVSGCFKGISTDNELGSWIYKCKMLMWIYTVYRQYDYIILLLPHHLVTSVWWYIAVFGNQFVAPPAWKTRSHRFSRVCFVGAAIASNFAAELSEFDFGAFPLSNGDSGSVVVWVFIFSSKDATKKQYAKA